MLIATAVFVRCSLYLKCRSRILQRRVRLMASNTGSSKRAFVPIYLRFSLLVGLHLWKNSCNVKYLENRERYHDSVNLKTNMKPPLGYQLAPWPLTLMTLNCTRSRSQNLHIKYLEYRERYNVGHNGNHIGNHQWASSWHHNQITLDDLEPF